MIVNPRVGQIVQCWYAAKHAHRWPYHGKLGLVLIAGRSKPRNHLIDIDGKKVVVPCGNIRSV